MSVQALAWAIELIGLTPLEKLTLLALANHAGPKDDCYPSQKALAETVGATDRTIRNALQGLEDKGLIQRQHRQRQDGSRTSDFYVLNIRSNRKDIPHPRNEMQGQPETVSDHEPVTEPISSEPKGSSESARKRATRIDEAWQPAENDLAYARSKGLSEHQIEAEAEKFKNHHLARLSRFVDWHAAWRTWVMKALEFAWPRAGPPPVDELARLKAKIAAGETFQ